MGYWTDRQILKNRCMNYDSSHRIWFALFWFACKEVFDNSFWTSNRIVEMVSRMIIIVVEVYQPWVVQQSRQCHWLCGERTYRIEKTPIIVWGTEVSCHWNRSKSCVNLIFNCTKWCNLSWWERPSHFVYLLPTALTYLTYHENKYILSLIKEKQGCN